MAILALLVSVVSFVIAIIALSGTSMIISKALNTHQNPPATTNSTEYSDDYKKGFSEGRDSTWYAIQLSYFDMFKDADIYDYEGTIDSLMSRMNKIIHNEEYRNTLTQELTNYMRDKNDSNDY